MDKCQLCKREATTLSAHHLIPRVTHSKQSITRYTTKDERQTTVDLCQPCHNKLHATFPTDELAREWNTIEKLLTHLEIQKFLKWLSGRPPQFKTRSKRVY